VTSGVTIGKGAVLLGKTGVSKSLEGSKTYFGSIAQESRKKMQEMAVISRLTKSQKKQ